MECPLCHGRGIVEKPYGSNEFREACPYCSQEDHSTCPCVGIVITVTLYIFIGAILFGLLFLSEPKDVKGVDKVSFTRMYKAPVPPRPRLIEDLVIGRWIGIYGDKEDKSRQWKSVVVFDKDHRYMQISIIDEEPHRWDGTWKIENGRLHVDEGPSKLKWSLGLEGDGICLAGTAPAYWLCIRKSE